MANTTKKSPKKTSSKAELATVKKAAFRSDTKQTAALVKSARKAATGAIKATKALGLPITYLEKGIVYREDSAGKKEVVETKRKAAPKHSKTPLKKGMVLHAKK